MFDKIENAKPNSQPHLNKRRNTFVPMHAMLMSYIRYLCMRIVVPAHIVLCFVFLRLVYLMLPVSL